MNIFFAVYMFGSLVATVGSWPDMKSCQEAVKIQTEELDLNFANPEWVKKLNDVSPRLITRQDIEYTCIETKDVPKLGSAR